VLGVVDLVLGPSQEFLEGGNELESSLIDRLLGQRFQEHTAEFAHRPSLTDPERRFYASTMQTGAARVAAVEQRESRTATRWAEFLKQLWQHQAGQLASAELRLELRRG
jgi:hypothetical protein